MLRHSPRQAEMLRLMGIEIWRNRGAFRGGDEVETGDTGVTPAQGSPRWPLIRSVAAARGTAPLVIIGAAGDAENPDAARSRLLDAILWSLGASRDRVTLACPVDDPSGQDCVTIEEQICGLNPPWVLVLDNMIHRQMGNAAPHWAGRGTLSIIGPGLDTLLRDPRAKADLWRRMVVSGAVPVA